MEFYKIFLLINRQFKKIIFKLMYRSRISWGRNFLFRKGLNIFIENEGKVIIGNNCFFNNNCSLNSHSLIKLGDNCIVGESVKIYDHNHNYKEIDKPIYKQGFSVADVIIGDNCWIGSNVTILKGVNIGNNSVIGANCLIYKDIKENSVVKNSICIKVENRLE